MDSTLGESIRDVYSVTARKYDMILKAYKALGVNLKKWRENAFARLPELSSPRILDVAVGTGVNLPYLIEKYPSYSKIIGIDYTPEMLLRARKRVRDGGWRNIELILGDARHLSEHITENFDLIISTYSLSIIPDSPLVLEEISKVLKPQGYLMLLDCQKFTGLLSVFNPMAIWLSKQLGGNDETYSVDVSGIAASMFRPVHRKLLYSGLFYEDLYQGKSH